MPAGPVTVLFTDLVSSTELLHRVGDEQGRRVLRAHHQLLRDVVTVHGGCEVKWLGDGLMGSFTSSADAVRCAVTMQQATRWRAAGERLAMRAGLHVGEALRDDSDWLGASVVLARRLCDNATAGQILCSGLVVELLGGRRAFRFGAIGTLPLKGFAVPVPAYEVQYDRDDPAAALRHTPFMGRAAELEQLERRQEEARRGRGGVLLLAGEPGIGKTRTLEEFAEMARAQEALVLWGRCYEGEAGRPYGPFAEAIAQSARCTSPDTLRTELGLTAAPLAQLVPALRELVPEIPDPAPLQPEEARVRLLDTVTQYLLAVAARIPTVLVLDDLHWADPGTVTLLRHLARFAARSRLLVLGAYRDVDVDARHPLTEALGTLPRETNYDRLGLAGLDAGAVRELLEVFADHDLAHEFASALTRETSGNPFFIRAVLLHLLEEGALLQEEGRWRVTRPIAELRLPDSVRQVIERRLARLSKPARRLLGVAAALTGGIDVEVARRVTGLDEPAALDALDEALGAQLLVPGSGATYSFTHALVRQALYDALSAPRQARLHRDIAETIEAVYGERARVHAAEIAWHYHRSAKLPGRERGVSFCVAAADQAQEGAAFADSVDHLRMALDLLPAEAPERSQLVARLGLALVWALRDEEARRVASEAIRRTAQTEGAQAAAVYALAVAVAMTDCGFIRGAWEVAQEGLPYTMGQHDFTWAILMHVDTVRREASDPDNPGMFLSTPEREEIHRLFENLGILGPVAHWAKSREDVVARGVNTTDAAFHLTFLGGEIRRAPSLWIRETAATLQRGQLAKAALCHAGLARCQLALGDFAAATITFERGMALADRFPLPRQSRMELEGVAFEHVRVLDDGWQEIRSGFESHANVAPEFYYYRAALRAGAALTYARLGHVGDALSLIDEAIPAIERAPGWAVTYPTVINDAVEVFWLLERQDHLPVLERNLREKVLRPDFRWPLRDARLSMGRLCAPQTRWNEAAPWFAKARVVLDEQGQRPLRAVVDYDEALMYARRDAPGDRARTLPLVDLALAQFRTLGMPGWIRRAEELQRHCERAPISPGRT